VCVCVCVCVRGWEAGREEEREGGWKEGREGGRREEGKKKEGRQKGRKEEVVRYVKSGNNKYRSVETDS
jgi:hypothetical protein